MRIQNLIKTGATIVMALAVWLPSTFAGSKKGAEMLVERNNGQGNSSLAVRAEPVAMTCPKCKTVYTLIPDAGRGAVKQNRIAGKHLCTNCQTIITTAGFGKAKKDAVKHVCQKCGAEMVNCCDQKNTAPKETK
jgi:predicted RNA-binding Zn-ribbon protein involved in translation (DUF1610 family)